MTFFFEVPIIFIIVLFLAGAGAAMALLESISYILFMLSYVALVFLGIIIFFKTLSAIFKTKRVYLIIPCAVFLIFAVIGMFLVYSFFCMSEMYLDGRSQRQIVYFYSLLICLAITVAFMLVFNRSFYSKIGSSILGSGISIILLILPVCVIGSVCNKQYYDKRVDATIGNTQLVQDIDYIWREVSYLESRAGRFGGSVDDYRIPCNISSGTTVYYTDRTDKINKEVHVEIYLPDSKVIGYVPQSVLLTYEPISEEQNTTEITPAETTFMDSELDQHPFEKQYWIIFTEGSRDDRIEMSTVNSPIGRNDLYIVWDGNLELNSEDGQSECNQYYLDESGEWSQIGTYGRLSDYASNIIASNLDVYDSQGNLIIEKCAYSDVDWSLVESYK